MKKAIRTLSAITMAFTILIAGSALSKSDYALAAQALCQYHRTDNVTWRDGNAYCKCCGQVNKDAYCKHNGQRYASYSNDWTFVNSYSMYTGFNCYTKSVVYRRDEHIKCSTCNKVIGNTGHYQQKVISGLNTETIITH